MAFDASAGSRSALEAAVRLASRLEAELEGLFVEDVNLLRLAGLPFARAFGAGGASRLDEAEMREALRAHAERAERAMAAAIRGTGVSWRFRTARGSIRAELLAAAAGAECVALGIVGELPARRHPGSTARELLAAVPGSLLLAAPGARTAGPVACLFDGTPAAIGALDRAAQLASAHDRRLTVYLTAPGSDEVERQRRVALERLAGRGLEVRYRRAPATDAWSLGDAILARRPATLVMARPAGMAERDFRQLLARLDGVVWLTPEAA